MGSNGTSFDPSGLEGKVAMKQTYYKSSGPRRRRMSPLVSGQGRVSAFSQRMARQRGHRRTGIAEDSPKWKWYSMGNRKAGAQYAQAHPAPRGYTTSAPNRRGVVTARPKPIRAIRTF